MYKKVILDDKHFLRFEEYNLDLMVSKNLQGEVMGVCSYLEGIYFL